MWVNEGPPPGRASRPPEAWRTSGRSGTGGPRPPAAGRLRARFHRKLSARPDRPAAPRFPQPSDHPRHVENLDVQAREGQVRQPMIGVMKTPTRSGRRLTGRLKPAVLRGFAGEVGAVDGAEAVEQPPEVELDRVLRQVDGARDLSVGRAFGDEGQDPPLEGAQV